MESEQEHKTTIKGFIKLVLEWKKKQIISSKTCKQQLNIRRKQ